MTSSQTTNIVTSSLSTCPLREEKSFSQRAFSITAIFQQHTKEETIQTLKEALEVLEQEKGDPENEEIF